MLSYKGQAYESIDMLLELDSTSYDYVFKEGRKGNAEQRKDMVVVEVPCKPVGIQLLQKSKLL